MIDWNNNGKIDPEEVFLTEAILNDDDEDEKPPKKPVQQTEAKVKQAFTGKNQMDVCGYPFLFLQEIVPECDANGNIREYYPQDAYSGRGRKPLNQYGSGAFCKFTVNAQNWPGVYLWVVDGEIIYIGETVKLWQRFNMGYGNIEPANCYMGGQSTNCKMNKAVLDLYRNGKTIEL